LDKSCSVYRENSIPYRGKKEVIHMHDSAKATKVQVSKDIFPAEAWELISKNRESDDLVIIDVSTPQEYEDLHLEGVINMNLLSKFFKTRLDVMDKSRTYLVYCKVGGEVKLPKS
jgi:hypothetical protein